MQAKITSWHPQTLKHPGHYSTTQDVNNNNNNYYYYCITQSFALLVPVPSACPPDYFVLLIHKCYRMRAALHDLAPRSNIKMKLTEDGSSIGTAFAAAMNYDGSPPSSTPR